MTALGSEPGPEVRDDADTPHTNAVVRVSGCSGALIAPDMVLTAAHCVVPKKSGAEARPHPACARLQGQARLAHHPWEAPTEWRSFEGGGIPILVGARRDEERLVIDSAAVAVPRCADIALLRLERPVPADAAVPLPVLSSPPHNPDRFFGTGTLRFAGWGLAKEMHDAVPFRQTGPSRYWGRNGCHIATIPPMRRNGARIISGDSGAPLLVTRDGREIVAGVIWGMGLVDPDVCRLFQPMPPRRHGLFTPPYRPAIPGTGATDIGAWLREMAPNAEHL